MPTTRPLAQDERHVRAPIRGRIRSPARDRSAEHSTDRPSNDCPRHIERPIRHDPAGNSAKKSSWLVELTVYGRDDAHADSRSSGWAVSSARLLVLDNVYMLGRPHGRALNEDTPMNPCSRKGEIRPRAAERLSRRSTQADDHVPHDRRSLRQTLSPWIEVTPNHSNSTLNDSDYCSGFFGRDASTAPPRVDRATG
jgi:hypothetical protein